MAPTKVLETYTLEEILEFNEYSEEEFLEYVVELGILILPEVLPLDASL